MIAYAFFLHKAYILPNMTDMPDSVLNKPSFSDSLTPDKVNPLFCLVDFDQEIGIRFLFIRLWVFDIGLDKERDLAVFTDSHPESELGVLVGL